MRIHGRSTARIALWGLLACALAVPAQTFAQPRLTVGNVSPTSPTTESEEKDYSTLVWNDPWDMNQDTDIKQLDSIKGVGANPFAVGSCGAGVWCGTSQEAMPLMYWLFPGYSGALHVGRDGVERPIDTSAYTQLTFRMNVDSYDAGMVGLFLMWTAAPNDVSGFNDIAKLGRTVHFLPSAGWHIYTIDLTNAALAGAGDVGWTGLISGLRFYPAWTGFTGRQVQLDWVRLSPKQSRVITWTSSGEPAGNAEIHLLDSSNIDQGIIYSYPTSGPVRPPSTRSITDNTYTFEGSLPPGDWKFRVRNTAVGGGTGTGALITTMARPNLSFVHPGLTTGSDYATMWKGNAWDFDSLTDIYAYINITSQAISSGMLDAYSVDTNANNACDPWPGTCNPFWEDPELYPMEYYTASAPLMDSTQFRYLTFKMLVDGQADISYGSIARWFWADSYPLGNCGITEDIPLHNGWNEVTLDLWRTDLTESTGDCGLPNRNWQATNGRHLLRFDPFEIPTATRFYVDYLTLTMMESAPTGSVFRVGYIPARTGFTYAFYYDTDKTAAGRLAAAMFTMPAPGSGAHSVFLPLAGRTGFSASPSDPAGTEYYYWNLSGVTPGTYYLCAQVSDGTLGVSEYVCSDAQISVTG